MSVCRLSGGFQHITKTLNLTSTLNFKLCSPALSFASQVRQRTRSGISLVRYFQSSMNNWDGRDGDGFVRNEIGNYDIVQNLKHQPFGNVRIKFANNPLDKQSVKRDDPAFVKEALEAPDTQFLIFNNLKPLIRIQNIQDQREGSIAWLCRDEIPTAIFEGVYEQMLFLGVDPSTNQARFAFDISPLLLVQSPANNNIASSTGEPYAEKEDSDNVIKSARLSVEEILDLVNTHLVSDSEDIHFRNARQSTFAIEDHDEAAIIGNAHTLINWSRNHKFCSLCGSSCSLACGGHKIVCTNSFCQSHTQTINVSYPRVDPVLITLVLSADGERALLGRKRGSPTGFYSCLAGFLEAGESVEEAARREVLEEAGVDIEYSFRYMFSQPWPFPGQLMIGGLGIVGGGKEGAPDPTLDVIVPDDDELDDVQWFTKAEVQEALDDSIVAFGKRAGAAAKRNIGDDVEREPRKAVKSNAILVPPPAAVAHQLLKAWTEGIPPLI
eukprot:Nk52_evm31s358 gene=Nk52_evmTU31s358